MADESPEQIRERVHAEELAKGSDPRVAEGRSKAAELRAKAGLPIEPDQAWRAKLEQEGGAPSAAGTATAVEAPRDEAEAEPEPEPEPEPAAEPEPAPAAEAEPAAKPEPAAKAGPAPGPEPQPEPQPATAREPATVAAAPAAPKRDPEVGEPIELVTEGLEVVAGIPIRDTRLPLWVTAVLIGLLVWAVLYGLFVSGADAIRETTGCRVEADRTLVCTPDETEAPPAE